MCLKISDLSDWTNREIGTNEKLPSYLIIEARCRVMIDAHIQSRDQFLIIQAHVAITRTVISGSICYPWISAIFTFVFIIEKFAFIRYLNKAEKWNTILLYYVVLILLLPLVWWIHGRFVNFSQYFEQKFCFLSLTATYRF